MADSVRQLRNLYFLGFYKKALTEAETLLKTEQFNTQAKTFYFRALLHVDPKEVFNKIPKNGPTSLQAIKLLGTYYAATDDSKEMVFDTLKDWLSDSSINTDATLQSVAAQIFFEEANYKEALKLVHNHNNDLEKMAICVQIYLKINRLDLAQKMVKSMQDVDDDDTLSQVALAWVQIAEGGDKIGEASFLLQDLIEKFGPSISVLNSLAVCNIQQSNHAAAFQYLKQAKDLAASMGMKTSSETFINSIVVLQLLKKSPEIIKKIMGEFEQAWPEDAWLKQYAAMDASFTRNASSFSWKQE